MTKALHTLLVSFVLALLAACGGSDSDGNNNNGNNGGANEVEAISVVAIETSKSAISADGSDFGQIFAFAPPQNGFQKTAKPTEEYNETVPGTCGGNIEVSMLVTTPDSEESIFPYSIDGQADMNSYCIAVDTYQILYNGMMVYEADFGEESLSLWFNYDLTYSSDHPEIADGSISASESCSGTSYEDLTCSFSSDYSYDGESYTLSSVSVSGDSSSGYLIIGDIEGEDGSSYEISASGLTFCDNGNFASGEIEITMDDGETATITFPSCTQYSVSFMGETETYDYD